MLSLITNCQVSRDLHPMIKLQKHPPRGAPRKRCTENMKQIYRKTPIGVLSLDESVFFTHKLQI